MRDCISCHNPSIKVTSYARKNDEWYCINCAKDAWGAVGAIIGWAEGNYTVERCVEGDNTLSVDIDSTNGEAHNEWRSIAGHVSGGTYSECITFGGTDSRATAISEIDFNYQRVISSHPVYADIRAENNSDIPMWINAAGKIALNTMYVVSK